MAQGRCDHARAVGGSMNTRWNFRSSSARQFRLRPHPSAARGPGPPGGRTDVAGEHAERLPPVFDEQREIGPAAEGFDAERAGPGKQVEHVRVAHGGAQDVEDRLAGPVGGRPRLEPRNGDQLFPRNCPAMTLSGMNRFCSGVKEPVISR